MSKPIMESLGGIHRLRWETERVSIRVDRIREGSDHEVKGEILVECSLPGILPHIHQARLNLTSTTAQRSLVRLLMERVPDVPWELIVEQACVMILRKYREGEPVVTLADVDMDSKLRYRVQPFVTEAEPSVLYGPGGVGKSTLATYWLVLVDIGQKVAGTEVEPGRGLYLDYEASKEEVARRQQAIRLGLGLPSKGTALYRFCVQPLAAEVEEIQRIVVERGIQFVVVDSAGPACGGEPEAAENALRYFAALRAIRVTSLTIAHVAKHPGKESSIFGSVFFQNIARNVWEMKKVQEAGEDKIEVGLFHRKCNTGKLEKPRGYRIGFPNNGTILFDPMEVSDVPEFEGSLPARLLIERALREIVQADVLTLAAATGQEESTIRQALHRGKGKSFVLLDGNRWALATPVENQASMPWEAP